MFLFIILLLLYVTLLRFVVNERHRDLSSKWLKTEKRTHLRIFTRTYVTQKKRTWWKLKNVRTYSQGFSPAHTLPKKNVLEKKLENWRTYALTRNPCARIKKFELGTWKKAAACRLRWSVCGMQCRWFFWFSRLESGSRVPKKTFQKNRNHFKDDILLHMVFEITLASWESKSGPLRVPIVCAKTVNSACEELVDVRTYLHGILGGREALFWTWRRL